MNNGYIGVLDSGVGGISTLLELIKVMPNERYLYFGDNKNAPYGNRTERDLLSLTARNIFYLGTFGLKAIVLACNTLSVTVSENLRSIINVPTFGVFPPVEKAALSGERTLLLATPRTIENYHRTARYDNVYPVALPNLAATIENDAGNLENADVDGELTRALTLDGLSAYDKAGAFDNVILGCTHYAFVENKIFNHFKPKILSNGNFYTAKLVRKKLKTLKSSVNNKGFELTFVGENARFNETFFEKVVNRSRFFQ